MSLAIKSIRSIAPLFDRVLIQRSKPVERSASGIFLPSSVTSNPPPEGTVIAVGPGSKDRDGKLVQCSVQQGDRVLLPSFGGQSLKIGEDEYQIYRDAEIIAKITEE
ncbi:uncharacterized protein L969DRAFT_85089 [Mixia osmundae IAM 14324]|uniref:10 kDa heat shock protein, mitochondrial n=1 Tax=Mixia osmundae (strain CBS 9802 / IAM 14324 / JCM 22182 / KY 12970) TaxID=764103 RepID=G7DXU8_MIXOS|nr:uncharacterized protein L969DRAFT_85089 [Mixia osmundae IAM 14324]KEI41311.1 hypothetical protein L969DRAFT_85089 [Mixia osmundae IAM 14324]GAA95408.1 hypothetical protein E5Q_02062 [Mixia osmundae IAM 14324]